MRAAGGGARGGGDEAGEGRAEEAGGADSSGGKCAVEALDWESVFGCVVRPLFFLSTLLIGIARKQTL